MQKNRLTFSSLSSRSTEPIIETSRNLTIGCYEYHYFNMAKHFEKSKLSVWNNKVRTLWSSGPHPPVATSNIDTRTHIHSHLVV